MVKRTKLNSKKSVKWDTLVDMQICGGAPVRCTPLFSAYPLLKKEISKYMKLKVLVKPTTLKKKTIHKNIFSEEFVTMRHPRK